MGTPYGQPGGWQQPYPAQPGGYGFPAGPRYDNDKSFFGALFDFTFDNFVAPKLIKFLYILSVVLLTLLAAFYVVLGFVAMINEQPVGLLAIILAPIGWFLYVMLTRVWLELMIVVFKISEDIKDIRDSRTLR
ncbi:DUF4282 domain-containing protein [Thermomonospora catenispora]|uniref:DUF4282 domain-containing protein n=1 Tax=Thermomonospora catenispora TaxID=2493090 RepID=UPI00112267AA|nr:DUF4282 domain-containing protein [Thermomonospora catenispora]TNY35140.1 DUF4282 domain-containing protein [Thermomonospora catenispora]